MNHTDRIRVLQAVVVTYLNRCYIILCVLVIYLYGEVEEVAVGVDDSLRRHVVADSGEEDNMVLIGCL